VQAVLVVPVDVVGGDRLDVEIVFNGPVRKGEPGATASFLYGPIQARVSVNLIEVYCEPAMLPVCQAAMLILFGGFLVGAGPGLSR
jgi:hypothetical protein